MEEWTRGTHLITVSLVVLVVSSLLGRSHGACTLPSDIRGNWVSSDKGTLNFTSDTIVDYPVNQITVSVSSLSFSCTEQSGDRYLLTSTDTFVLFSLTFRAYLCLEFHQVSDYKYWYQIGNMTTEEIHNRYCTPIINSFSAKGNIDVFANNTDSDIEPTNNERFLARPELTTIDLTNGCDRTEPYDTATYNTLIKQGAVDAGLAEATCPYQLLHTFSAGSLESADGTNNCTNVTINMCSDRTRMIQTYDPACDSSVKIASGGISICLLDLTNDTTGVTYLHVWNNDTSLATGVNRINCYVNFHFLIHYRYPKLSDVERTFKGAEIQTEIKHLKTSANIANIDNKAFTQIGDTFTGTLYPSSCTADQTDTDVTAPGIKVYYDTIAKTCQNIVESGPQTVYFVAVILGALVLLFIIILVICISVKTKCRCCKKLLCKKKKVGHSDSCLSMSPEDGLEAYASSARKDAIDGMFKARKPIKLGPIIEPYLRPPPKVELLYDIEPPRPTSSKLVFNRALFMSQVSLKCK